MKGDAESVSECVFLFLNPKDLSNLKKIKLSTGNRVLNKHRESRFFLTSQGHQCGEVAIEQASKSRNKFLKALEIEK